MIGLCLALLVAGAPSGAQLRPAFDPVELRLHRAVVVPEDALDAPAEDSEVPEAPGAPAPPAKAPVAPAGQVPLRPAVVSAPVPTKEHR